ncbi:MAG TPA: hypothetical protein VHQ64_17700 [Pyrinomonadaceae bacterium]|jgi:exonuclease VII large subunit|nr:hypothetical protein [Pyrinomonadaceae bacterium]
MKTKQPTIDDSAESAVAPERSTDELYAEADRLIRQMDQIVHDELSHKPEAVAEWEEIMRDYEAGLAEDQREAEEEKLGREINEWLERINAEIDQLMALDPADLEFDDRIARMFASWNEADAVMRLRCRHYPDKLARWEKDVMGSVKRWEAAFADAMEKDKSKPAN